MNKIIKNFCLWLDLLGFSNAFIESKWNLNNPIALKNILRIEVLKDLFLNSAAPTQESTIILNDACARSIDLIYNKTSSLNYVVWLNWTLLNIYQINHIEINNGFPGARAIFSSGDRYYYMPPTITSDKMIYANPETLKELKSKITIYAPIEFQMNLAFSKAYILDKIGSKGGIKNNCVYMDSSFINDYLTFLEKEQLWNCWKHKKTADSLSLIENWKKIKYKSEWIKEDKYIILKINRAIENKRIAPYIFWFDKEIINIKTNSIETNVYKLIKYKAIDDNSIIDFSKIEKKYL